MSENTIFIYEIVGSNSFVSIDSGQKVFELIAMRLERGDHVVVSFAQVSKLTSAFLNAAIGQLYGKYSEETIRSQIELADLLPEHRNLIKRVVETAKEYFSNPSRYQRAKAALGVEL